MNIRDFERFLTRYASSKEPQTAEQLLGESESEQRIGALRQAGGLPVGGRGPHAPQVNSLHVARMFLQMVARRASDSYAIGERAAKLRLVMHPDVHSLDGFDAGATLIEALKFLIDTPAYSWRRLEVACDGNAAWLTICAASARDLTLWFTDKAAGDIQWVTSSASIYENQGAAFMGYRFVLGAGVVKQAAIHLSQNQDAGELADQ